MKSSKCGARIDIGAMFCDNCGNKINKSLNIQIN